MAGQEEALLTSVAAARPVQPALWQRSKWPDAILIIVLSLLPLLFFWRLITPAAADRLWIAGGDFTEQYFPLRAFTAQEWVQGRIPLWNPYLYGGQPALADIQSGALYPPHVIEALLLGWIPPLFGQEIGFPIWALEWQAIFHFSVAAVGSYLFVRHIQVKQGILRRQARFGAVIASLAFTYSGYLTGFPVQQMTILAVSAWLPWTLWGLEAVLGQISPENTRFNLLPWPAIAWTALVLAMAILAGHPQTTLYIFYLTLAYTIFKAFSWRQNRPVQWLVRSMVYSLGVWAGLVLLGVSLSAAQLLPTLEFIAYSLRADLSYQAVSAGLPLTELIAILYPGFFGGSPQYIGIATLVLVALALTLAWSQYKASKTQGDPQSRRQNDLEKRGLGPIGPVSSLFFWMGAGLISLLLAFGGRLFVYPVFYLLAPGFDMVRQQERVFLVYSFSAAILAGYGAAALTSPLPKRLRQAYSLFERRLYLAAGVALAVTAFFIYGSATATARGEEINLFFGVLRHHLFGLIILGGMLLFFRVRRRRWLRRPWGMGLVAGWLAFNLFTVNWRFNLEPPPDPEPFIANGLVQFLQTNLSSARSPSSGPGRVASGGLLPGGNNAASVFNLQDLTGNTPLQLAAVHHFLERMPAWRLWQLMNVRYVIDRRDIGDPGLRPVFEEAGLKVFEMGDPFERARFVSPVEVVTDEAQSFERLSADDFDLRRSAVVMNELTVSLSDASGAAVVVSEFSPTQLTINVNSVGHHLLVLSQIYYPGWQVTIDGQPAELLRVNLIQQGLVSPPGEHVIQLNFRPASFITGAMISAAALFICLGLLIWRGMQPAPLSNFVAEEPTPYENSSTS